MRKVVVGDNYNFCIKYVKGSQYKIGTRTCKLVDFISQDDGSIDIYVEDDSSTFLWKTVNTKPLEIEYDANFE